MRCFPVLAFFALASFTTALPKACLPFQVSNMNTFEPSGRPGQSNIYRVGFNVTDPNDSSATFCGARWDYRQATTGYPSNYLANCTDPSYAFKFTDYHTYYDFVLDVKHKNKKHGKKVTRFASGLVTFDIIQCAHAASGFSVCNQRDGVLFPLEVYKVQK